MVSEASIVEQLAEKIVDKMGPFIKSIITQTVQEEVVKALKRALFDSEFYKELSDDVLNGIESIYKEISLVKKDITVDPEIEKALQTIGQSRSILDSILEISESSTLKIMDIIENLQEDTKHLRAIDNGQNNKEVEEITKKIEQKLLEILTLLSFQDITGQKIKKLIESLKKIEDITFELYVSSEAFKKSKKEGVEKTYSELKEEIKKKVESAKAKKEIIDQSAIDEILASTET